MESITAKAIPLLEDGAKPETIEDDWMSNFFDRSRIVSDDMMQKMWSRILAGESNKPGTFSRRTVNLMADIDAEDAELFTALCRFIWVLNGIPCSLVYDLKDKIYEENNISFGRLFHLDSIGLIQFNQLSGYVRRNLPGAPELCATSYFGRLLLLSLPEETDSVDIGKVSLTLVGQQLSRICQVEPVDGFFEYVKDRWKDVIAPVQITKPDSDLKIENQGADDTKEVE